MIQWENFIRKSIIANIDIIDIVRRDEIIEKYIKDYRENNFDSVSVLIEAARRDLLILADSEHM